MTTEPQPLDHGQLIVGLIDSVVVLAVALTRAGLVTREQLAEAYREAEAQQAAQIHDGAARRLAVQTVGSFFGTPIRGGRPDLKLVVDNSAE